MSTIKIGPENVDAENLIPPAKPDGSGIGVNYADAYIKPINTKPEDGPAVSCRRRGLKITLTIGDREGEGLMRRIANGPDPRNILRKALEEAAGNAGAKYLVKDGTIFLDLLD